MRISWIPNYCNAIYEYTSEHHIWMALGWAFAKHWVKCQEITEKFCSLNLSPDHPDLSSDVVVANIGFNSNTLTHPVEDAGLGGGCW